MAEEKTSADQQASVDEQAYRNTAYAPQCPPVGTNKTFNHTTKRKYVRYQRRATYHYHHAP